MAEKLGTLLSRTIEGVVRWVIVPVTGVIPFLVSSGVLFVVFAATWLGFGAALVASPNALGDAWRSISGLPRPIVGLAWLLFLPPMAGLWVWATSWPIAVRIVVILALAGWNLLVFVPHGAARPASVIESKALDS